jgi:NADH:ubiquinone oxidoreductase subunit D
LVNIGGISFEEASKYGASGVVLRSTGEKKDLRFIKSDCYSFYWFLQMQSYLGKRGDCYDRFLIRIREMYESVNIIFQVISNLVLTLETFKTGNKSKSFNFFYLNEFIYNKNYNKNFRNSKYTSMESLIEHFKYYSYGIEVPKGFSYKAVEAPKGEFGVSIISDGSSNPYRCKLRSPAFHHLALMPRMIQGHMFADMITILGSQDIVFGEVDR